MPGARRPIWRNLAVVLGTLCVVGIVLSEWEIFAGTALERAFRDGFIAEGCLLGLVTISVSWWVASNRRKLSAP